MRVKCYHADRVQCSFQCTGVNNRKEPGTQRGLSGLPFFLLIYCGVVNKPLHLSASISLSVNSNHSNPFLKRVWRISLLSIKMLSEKKKTTFLSGKNISKEESRSLGFLDGCLVSYYGSPHLCSFPWRRNQCYPCPKIFSLPLLPLT